MVTVLQPSSRDAEMEDEASVPPEADNCDFPISPISDVPASPGASLAKDKSQSVPSVAQINFPSARKDSCVPVSSSAQSVPSSVVVCERDNEDEYPLDHFGAGQTDSCQTDSILKDSVREAEAAAQKDASVKTSSKRVTRRTYSKLASFLDAGAETETRLASPLKNNINERSEDGKNPQLSSQLLPPPSEHSSGKSPPSSPLHRSLSFPSSSPVLFQHLVIRRMSAMGDAGSDLVPFTSDVTESSARLHANMPLDSKTEESSKKPLKMKEASKEHSKTEVHKSHPETVDMTVTKTEGPGGQCVSDFPKTVVKAVNGQLEASVSLQNGELFFQSLPQSPRRVTRRMSSRIQSMTEQLQNFSENTNSHSVVNAELSEEKSVGVGCDGQSKTNIKALETVPVPLPTRRITRRMSSRNNSECEVHETGVSKEKCAPSCENIAESKVTTISQSDNVENLSLKDSSSIKPKDMNNSEIKNTEKDNLTNRNVQGRDFGVSLENEDSRQRTASSSQLVPQRMVTRRMSSRMETSDSERELSLSPKKRGKPSLSSSSTSSSTGQVVSGSKKQKSNFGFGECTSLQPDNSMEGILDDFLYAPSDLKAPEQAGRVRSRNSSEKENNEPPKKTPSPAKRQLVFGENKTASPVPDENKTALPILDEVGKDIHEDCDNAHKGSQAAHDVSGDDSEDESDEGKLEEEDVSETQPSHNEGCAAWEDGAKGEDTTEKAEHNIVKKVEIIVASNVASSADVSPQKREGSHAAARSSKNLLQSSPKKPGCPPKIKKSEPVSVIANSLLAPSSSASSAESDSEDTSDLSFSDTPLSPQEAPARGHGRGRGRGRGLGRASSRGRGQGWPCVKRRGQVDLLQSQKIDNAMSQNCVSPPRQKKKSALKARRAQVNSLRQSSPDESSRDSLLATSSWLKKKPSSPAQRAGFPAPGDLDDESSRDSLPVGSPTKKKVPTIQESDSSESENDAMTANMLCPKFPSSMNKITLCQQSKKTPAIIESSDSEDEKVSKAQKTPNDTCNGGDPGDSHQKEKKSPVVVESDMNDAEDHTWVSSKKPSPQAVEGMPSEAEKASSIVPNISPAVTDIPYVSRQWSVCSGGFDVSVGSASLSNQLNEGTPDQSMTVVANSVLRDPLDAAPHAPVMETASQEVPDTAVEKSGSFTEKQNGSESSSSLPKRSIEENFDQTGSNSKDAEEGQFVPVGMYYHHLDHQYVTQLSGPSVEQAESLLEVKMTRPSAEQSSDTGSSVKEKCSKASEEHGLDEPKLGVVIVDESEKMEPDLHSHPLESATVCVDICSQSHVDAEACTDRSEIVAAISSDSVSQSLNAAAETRQSSRVGSSIQACAKRVKELSDGYTLSRNASVETPGKQQKSRDFHTLLDSGSKCIQPCAELCLTEIEADCKRGDSPSHPDLIRPEAVFLNPASTSQASTVGSLISVRSRLLDVDKSSGINVAKSPEVVKDEKPQWTPSAVCSDGASADSRDTLSTIHVRSSAFESSTGECSKTVLCSGLVPSTEESSCQQNHSSVPKRKSRCSVEEARESCESANAQEPVGQLKDPRSSFSCPQKRMSGSFVPPAERAAPQHSVTLSASVHSQPEATENSECFSPEAVLVESQMLSSLPKSANPTTGAAAYPEQDPAVSVMKTAGEQASTEASSPDGAAAIPPVCVRPKLVDGAGPLKDASGPSKDGSLGQLAQVLSLLDVLCHSRQLLSPLPPSPLKSEKPRSESDLSLREFLPPLLRPPPPSMGRKANKQKHRKKKADQHLSVIAKEAAIYAASHSSSASALTSHKVDVSRPVAPSVSDSMSRVPRKSSLQRTGVKLSAASQKVDGSRLLNPVEKARKEMLMRHQAAAE